MVVETERGFTASGDGMLSSQKVNFCLHDRVIFVNVPIEWGTSLGQEGDGRSRSSSPSSAYRDRMLELEVIWVQSLAVFEAEQMYSGSEAPATTRLSAATVQIF